MLASFSFSSQMRPLKIHCLIALFAFGQLSLLASTAESGSMLELVTAEVAARRLIRDHENGVRRANESELATARAVVRRGEERRAREVASAADGSFKIEWVNATIDVVAHACHGIFGGDFIISNKLQLKKVSIKVASPELDTFRADVRSALAKQGVFFRLTPTAIIMEASPGKEPK
jgi:hypothetical protein